MKRTTALVASATLLVTLTACGSSTNSERPSQACKDLAAAVDDYVKTSTDILLTASTAIKKAGEAVTAAGARDAATLRVLANDMHEVTASMGPQTAAAEETLYALMDARNACLNN